MYDVCGRICEIERYELCPSDISPASGGNLAAPPPYRRRTDCSFTRIHSSWGGTFSPMT